MSKDEPIVSENPLHGPHRFEGLFQQDYLAKELKRALQNSSALLAGSRIVVARNGENANGTWGAIALWNGTDWDIKGYTLEPRASNGKGPIPLGEYSFIHWMSSNLGKTLRLSNVPGFTDVLVHVGNTQDDTVGCILVGRRVDDTKTPTQLIDSRPLIDWLYDNCPAGTVLVRSV